MKKEVVCFDRKITPGIVSSLTVHSACMTQDSRLNPYTEFELVLAKRGTGNVGIVMRVITVLNDDSLL